MGKYKKLKDGDTLKMDNKRVILISDSEDICYSFKRALKAVGGIDMIVYSLKEDKYCSEKGVFMFYSLSSFEEIYPSLCKARNCSGDPMILIGFDTDIYSNPKSRAFSICQKSHRYFSVPLDIWELLSAIKSSVFLSQKEGQKVYSTYFHWLGLVKSIVNHDLKNSVKVYKSKEQILDIYNKIKGLIPSQYPLAISKINELIKKVTSLPELSTHPGFIDTNREETQKFILEYKSFLNHLKC